MPAISALPTRDEQVPASSGTAQLEAIAGADWTPRHFRAATMIAWAGKLIRSSGK